MEFTRDDLRIGDLLAPEFMELLDQKRAPEASPDEWWAAMEPVFDSDWPQHR